MPPQAYRHPPIVEALCEFQFAGGDWDWTIPGRFQEQVRATYGGKAREQKVVQANFDASRGPTTPALSMTEGIARIQLPSVDGQRMVAVGPQVVSIHVFKPYPGWSEFRPKIREALEHYTRLVEPESITRIGVRYINHVELAGIGHHIADLFACGPGVLGLPGADHRAFLTRSEYHLPNSRKLLITHASIGAPENRSAFLLDLDAIWEGSMSAMERAMETVDALHELEGDAFEAAIGDRLREVFDAS